LQIQRWEYQSQHDPVTLITTSHLPWPQCWFGEPPLLVTTESDRTIRLWDLDRGRLVRELAGHADSIRTVDTLTDRSLLVSVGRHSIRLWEHDSPKPWQNLDREQDVIRDTAVISPNGRRLAKTHNAIGDYRVILADIHAGGDGGDEGDADIELIGHEDLVASMVFNHDGSLLASADYAGVVCVWDTARGVLLERFTDHLDHANSVAFSPGANLLASAGGLDSTITLRDLDTGQVRTLRGHTNRVPSVSFSPDGRVLASASMDGTVRLWDIATGQVRRVFRPHDERGVRTVRFSPDGLVLATGGDDDSVALIDLRSGEIVSLRGHPTAVFNLAFGPEGRVLVSGDRGGNLMLWDVQTHKRLITLPKHQDMIMSISISPDGSTMATSSGGHDPEVRLWDLGAFAPHIAGNLEFHAARLEGTLEREPANLAPMLRWASEVRGLR